MAVMPFVGMLARLERWRRRASLTLATSKCVKLAWSADDGCMSACRLLLHAASICCSLLDIEWITSSEGNMESMICSEPLDSPSETVGPSEESSERSSALHT